MSRCSEYERRILAKKEEIRDVDWKLESVVLSPRQREALLDKRQLLKEGLEDLNGRLEQSRRRGGC